jgi:hypothetical protein
VAVRQNRAGFFSFGQQMPDIREGDTLQPGMPVADLLDLSELEVVTKVGELDRANLKEGQDALLQLDAIPDKQFRGKIKAMSGTATSDVFSGDPSKKFDVIFSVDMRQLLSGLGMKTADVDRIMATAETNSKKNLVNTASSFFSSLQGGMPGTAGAPGAAGGIPGMPGVGQPGMAGQMAGQDNQDQGDQGGQGGGRGRQGGGGQSGAGGGQPGGRGGDSAAGGARGGQTGGRGGDPAAGSGPGRGMASLSDEDRQKMQQLRQQAQSASEADRPKIMQQMQDLMAKAGGGRGPGGPGGRGAQGDGAAVAGDGRRGGGPGGPGGPGGAGAGFMGGGNPADMMRGGGGGGGRNGSPYTEDERNNAKLPIPPEQDSQVQALLRPGLLSDVEIVVEKIPDVLHVPTQAVFQRNGKFTVYVQQKNGKFEAREVQLQKQSESLMVLASGVQPGEVIALADPTADKSKKAADKKSAPSSPMGGMPGGK